LRLGDGFPFALIANIADRYSGLHRLGDDGQLQIRRKPPSATTPVITSTFENVSNIGVRPDLSLGPPAKPVSGQNRAQFTNLWVRSHGLFGGRGLRSKQNLMIVMVARYWQPNLTASYEQSARPRTIVRDHKSKVTVFVSHYAMSRGTLVALSARRNRHVQR
jgi:hypothetical protein